jgi:hypothetical protein
MLMSPFNQKATPMFKKPFDGYVCHGDRISCTVGDTTYTARLEVDIDCSPDDFDCYDDEAIAAWKRDEWRYYGVVIDAERDGWEKRDLASLWGIEGNFPGSDNSYLLEVANELLSEAIEEVAA